jgi:serine/threonine protein kinase
MVGSACETLDPPATPPGRSPSLPPGLAPGLVVGGKYELLRKIGSGAMGEVWAARHATLDEEVAIKLVLRGVDSGDGTTAESRFLLEARVAASLSRKTRHIVAVTDHGQDGELGYLVMELLAGESLDAAVARTGPLPLARVVPIIVQIARGLSIAHADGVTHRDLKPSNVFVTVDEEGQALAKVLDFGIAKLRPKSDRRAAFTTQRGFLLGTPAYMSPEQARGKPVDHRADVWALAVIAYHLLTGEFPFDAESGEELFARIMRVRPIPIAARMPELPAVVGHFFERAFAKRLEDRFQSAHALAGAFEQLEPLAGERVLGVPPPALHAVDADFALLGVVPPPETGSSIVVAGLPRRRRLGRAVAGGALAFAAVASTAGLLSIYFEREPAPRVPAVLSTGASFVRPPVAPERSTVLLPPASEEAAIAPPRVVTRPVARTVIAAEPALPAVPSPRARHADKSEIF